jgi:hypothetical protein
MRETKKEANESVQLCHAVFVVKTTSPKTKRAEAFVNSVGKKRALRALAGHVLVANSALGHELDARLRF